MAGRRETVFEVNLRQENARLRILIRHMARHCPVEISKPVIDELEGLPQHYKRPAPHT